jgi:DNA polymerase III epsilon subunit-like protein
MRAFLDVETTGFEPGQIAQLSYIITDDDMNVLKANNFYFAVDKMPKAASDVHGLTKAKLKKLSEGKEFHHHAKEIHDDLNGVPLICHNVDFDEEFITTELSWAMQKITVPATGCTMRHFTDLCKLKGGPYGEYKYPKLAQALRYAKIAPSKVKDKAIELFGSSEIDFHDSRFDVTAVYLLCKDGMSSSELASMIKPRRIALRPAPVAATAENPENAPSSKRQKANWVSLWIIASAVLIIADQTAVGLLSLIISLLVLYRHKKLNRREK